MKVYDSWDSFTITGRGLAFAIKDDWTLENLPRFGDVIQIDQMVCEVLGVERCLVFGHDTETVCPHQHRIVLVRPVTDNMAEVQVEPEMLLWTLGEREFNQDLLRPS
jgi:hypothetical protein